MNSIRILHPIFHKILSSVFNADLHFGNLELEDGFNLLQEDGSLINLE
jgi:hypothetical protein